VIEPRRRADGRLSRGTDPLEGLDQVPSLTKVLAVPMNLGERDLCRRAVRELIEREGSSVTSATVLELLNRAMTLEMVRRTL